MNFMDESCTFTLRQIAPLYSQSDSFIRILPSVVHDGLAPFRPAVGNGARQDSCRVRSFVVFHYFGSKVTQMDLRFNGTGAQEARPGSLKKGAHEAIFLALLPKTPTMRRRCGISRSQRVAAAKALGPRLSRRVERYRESYYAAWWDRVRNRLRR